ncbi:nucleotide disphospho-sugar-binding domain-containing protein [Streptomyces anulatus]|uniref:nucleotide disphospho-sugar-binding domain-containing protein n=1 Tax=Streptomyces anulatus TaxID=1892 RepID=UPI00342BBD6E
MRVLFATVPAPAHVYPVVPLAWALRAAGHETVVASHPDVADTVTAAGLTAVSLGERDFLTSEVPTEQAAILDRITDELELGPGEANFRTAIRHFMLETFGLYHPDRAPEPGSFTDELVDFATAWRPDLVIWDPLCFPAAVAARTVGAAHARILHAFDHFGWARQRYTERMTTDRMAAMTRPTLDRYGIAFGEDLLVGQWTLDLKPPRTRLPVRVDSRPLRRIPYSDDAPLPRWLHAHRPERPRVCLTLGVSRRSFFAGGDEHPVAEFFDLAADLDLELVATLDAGQLASVGTVPDNVRVLDYVPLTALLPTCAAVVHHGGAGTLAVATAHRVPQLVIPAVGGADRMETGQYVAASGAGLVLTEDETTPEVLRDSLLRLLTEPGFREGADRLHQEWLDTPSPAATVPLLEQMAAQHRTGPGSLEPAR